MWNTECVVGYIRRVAGLNGGLHLGVKIAKRFRVGSRNLQLDTIIGGIFFNCFAEFRLRAFEILSAVDDRQRTCRSFW